jgi:hypothetical protein
MLLQDANGVVICAASKYLRPFMLEGREIKLLCCKIASVDVIVGRFLYYFVLPYEPPLAPRDALLG